MALEMVPAVPEETVNILFKSPPLESRRKHDTKPIVPFRPRVVVHRYLLFGDKLTPADQYLELSASLIGTERQVFEDERNFWTRKLTLGNKRRRFTLDVFYGKARPVQFHSQETVVNFQNDIGKCPLRVNY